MGVVLVPTILVTMARWITANDPPRARRAQLPVALVCLFVVLGASLGSAIAASLCIHALGWITGTLVFTLALWALSRSVAAGRSARSAAYFSPQRPDALDLVQ